MIRSNAQDREEIIKQFTEEQFYADETFSYLWDVYPPPCFIFIFNVFLELYNHSRDCITWSDIDAYCRCRNITLQQIEIDYILKCNNWANETITELKKDEE